VAEKVRLYKRYSRVGLRLLFYCHVKETRLNSGNSKAVLEYRIILNKRELSQDV